jgi:hypothetical protein
MPNRIVLRDPVSLGDKFKIAVFAINGPISAAPSNSSGFARRRSNSTADFTSDVAALVQFGGLPIFQRPDGLKAVRWLGS